MLLGNDLAAIELLVREILSCDGALIDKVSDARECPDKYIPEVFYGTADKAAPGSSPWLRYI